MTPLDKSELIALRGHREFLCDCRDKLQAVYDRLGRVAPSDGDEDGLAAPLRLACIQLNYVMDVLHNTAGAVQSQITRGRK